MRTFGLPLLIVLVFATPAAAKDFEEEGRVRDAQSLCNRLDDLAAVKDRAGLEKTLPEVPPLHNALKTKSALVHLQKAVARILEDEEQNIMVRLAAVDTLADLHDESGVWKQLKPFMPDARDETVGRIELRVVAAVGEVAPDAAIGDLEDLARKAKDMKAAEAAITALGRYGYSKRREKVLKGLMDTLTRLRPGATRDRRGQDRARYDTLREAIVNALNRLTGQAVEGVELWLELYKENKKTPSKLFRYER